MDAKSVEEFQEQIGIKFHEPSRLWNAFIHSSYANERRMSKDKNNEVSKALKITSDWNFWEMQFLSW